MPKTPENSTSRAALSVAGASLDLAALAASDTEEGDPQEAALSAVATILRQARDLRPYQIEEVIGFVATRLGLDAPDLSEGQDDGAETLGQLIADLPERRGQTG